MTSEKKQEYTRRIIEANPTGVIAITYEIARGYYADAITAFRAGDRDTYRLEITRGNKCIEHLIMALDPKYTISIYLMRIYNYILECTRKASFTYDTEELKEPMDILARIGGSFEEIAPQDKRPAGVEGGAEVYDGLTYNAKGLTNTTVRR
ncbi:MAG: flagellar protein FliS [Lachnospiraceae bacterium]|jgi:flagellar protein FliS|nr:flagellar protein FliS [Lachnospiraceae bacterium]MCR5410242.1 flagellar protein FliS [Lachnospiraceae bacterium]